MKVLAVERVKIHSKKEKVVVNNKEYTMSPINLLHSELKSFLAKFKGISERYLQGYIALFEYLKEYPRHYQKHQNKAIIQDLICSFTQLRIREIDNGTFKHA
jgi:hypothetical protein